MKRLLFWIEVPHFGKVVVIQPSLGRYHDESYGWDQAFAAFIFLGLGLRHLATLVSIEMTAKIEQAGYQPLVTRWNKNRHTLTWKVRTNGDPRFSTYTQQPLLAQAALELSKDKDSLWEKHASEVVAAAQRNIDWLLSVRDPYQHHLASIIDPIESGMDSLVVWDEYALSKTPRFLPKSLRLLTVSSFLTFHYWRRRWNYQRIFTSPQSFIVEPVSLNVFIVRELLALASLWERLGEKEKSRLAKAGAEKVLQAIEDRLWDKERKAYFPKRTRSNEGLETFSIESVWPLLLPDLPLNRVERLVELIDQRLRTNGKFLPVSPADPNRGNFPRVNLLWEPGQVWSVTNWMFRDALAYHAERLKATGRERSYGLAWYLSRRIDFDWQTLTNRAGFREYWDGQTELGGGEENFFWPGLIVAEFPMNLT